MSTASHYNCPAGRWIRNVLHNMGIDVVIDDSIRAAYAASRSRGAIWLPPGLAWPDAHTAVSRGYLYLSGGAEFAPEFTDSGRAPRLSGDAAVVDIATARNVRRLCAS